MFGATPGGGGGTLTCEDESNRAPASNAFYCIWKGFRGENCFKNRDLHEQQLLQEVHQLLVVGFVADKDCDVACMDSALAGDMAFQEHIEDTEQLLEGSLGSIQTNNDI